MVCPMAGVLFTSDLQNILRSLHEVSGCSPNLHLSNRFVDEPLFEAFDKRYAATLKSTYYNCQMNIIILLIVCQDHVSLL